MKSNYNPLNLGIVLFLGCSFLAQAGDVFISDSYSGTILQLSSGGSQSVFASGLNHPEGLAFDGGGNLYVADSGSGSILRFSSAGGESVFASGLNNPAGLAFGSNGNLYVATAGDGMIRQFDVAGTGSVFASGLENPGYLAFGSDGSLYVSTPHTIEAFNASGNQSTLFSGFNYVYGLAADNSGDLYAGLQNAGSIIRVSGTGGPQTPLSYPYSVNPFELAPTGLAFDQSGNLYATFAEFGYYGADGDSDTLNGTVMEFNANGTGTILASGLNNPEYIAVQSTVTTVQFVPEPSTWAIMFAGLCSFLAVRRMRCSSRS